jgi:drug/metabolite transporter (DMT)-like permease
MVSIPAPIHLSATSLQQRRALLSTRVLAVVALVSANLIWGAAPAATTAAQTNVDPLTIGAGRLGLAVLVFALLLRLRHERMATGREPAMLGLLGMTLYCVFHNYGLLFADATTTTLIGGAMPVLIAALAVPVLGERLRGRQLVGLLLSMAGVAAIVLIGSGRSPQATLGGLLPLASAVTFSLYAVRSRRSFGTASSLPIVAGATRYGFLFLLPGVAVEAALSGPPTVTAMDAMLLLYLGVACSGLGFAIYGYAIVQLGAGRTAAFFNIRVISGVTLSMAMFGDALTPARIVGGMLVLLGVAVASRGDNRRLPGDPHRATATGPATRAHRGHTVLSGGTP